MRPLSATDAIQPAWDHARRLAVAPRSWRLALKITAVAFFARVGGCNSNFNNIGKHSHSLPPAIHAAIMGALVLLGIVAVILGLLFFYLGSRLQFVLFDSVLRSDTTIAPIWRRYGRATWYWIGLKVLFFVIAMICLSPVLIPMIVQGIHMAHNDGGANPAHLFAFIFSVLGTVFLFLIVFGIGYTLLGDFGLPSMAMEGTPLGETVKRIWRLVRAETGQVLLYLLMRFVLGIAASICCLVALLIAALIAAIPFGGIGLTTWLSLRHMGTGGHIFMVAALVVLGLIYVLVMSLVFIMLFGYAQLFFQAYALYFLGGRYPLVGAYLEPFVPQPYGYPPVGYRPPPPVEGAV
jgi:hypothetical protein